MVGMRKYIIAKALRCIDEVYPDDNDANGPHFPLEEFIDEAGRRVLLAAPLHAIPNRAALTECVLRPHTDGSGEIDLPDDFLKLARLRIGGLAASGAGGDSGRTSRRPTSVSPRNTGRYGKTRRTAYTRWDTAPVFQRNRGTAPHRRR